MHKHLKQTLPIVGKVLRKVADSAVHAAVFAFVSKKVSDLLEREKEKNKNKVRVETDPTAAAAEVDATKTGCCNNH